jgi:tetratricopeptide (TPR) repeat protein
MSDGWCKGRMISLCMIVRDEARDLSRCLASVAQVVDEMVVFDTGSRDATVRIATAHGARVVQGTWNQDFAVARNSAMAHAMGDWLLILDADEELDGADRRQLRAVVEGARWEAGRLRVRNLQPPGALCGFYDARITRLFRNRPEYRYEGAIHEQITPAVLRAGGTVADVDLTIIHHGYVGRNAQGGGERSTRNLALLEQMIAAGSKDPYVYYHIGATYKSLHRTPAARTALRRALAAGEEALGKETADLAHMKLAQLALADNELAEAARHAEASLAADPDNLLSLHVLALALLLQGDVARAYPLFQRIRASAGNRIRDVSKLDAILAHCREFLDAATAPKRHDSSPEG